MGENPHIPNSYQTPNLYADRFMHLVTGEEWKVLSYTMRRIFGFQLRQDHISLSQFQNGKKGNDGEFLDHGTGLSRAALLKALGELLSFGLMIRVEDNDPTTNEGDCYALQLNPKKVDVEGLEARADGWRQRNASRTSKARIARAESRSVGQTAPAESARLSDRPAPPSVGQTAPRLSDRPPPVCDTDSARSVGQTHETQKETQGRNPGETQTRAAAPPAAPPAPAAAREGVSVFGKTIYSADQRKAYALAHPSSIKNPDQWVWSKRTCAGDFDEAIREWYAKGQPVEGSAATAQAPDTSACPDCGGRGYYFDDPQDPKTHRVCKHPRLAEGLAELHRQYDEARAQLTAPSSQIDPGLQSPERKVAMS